MSLIVLGVTLLIAEMIMYKGISYVGCFLIAAGIASWLLDLDIFELIRFSRRR
jgi:hypothetical protein